MINCVEEFHKLGFVHLDIKVNNILFGDNDHAYNFNCRREFSDLVSLEENEQMKRLECYHKNKYIFKTTNLKKAKMYLIDFGCSHPYIKDGKHIENVRSLKDKNRNLIFASKNYFNGQTLSRRDDIISILYNLIYLMNPHKFKMGEIFQSENFIQSFKDMRDYKLKSSPLKICSETQRTKCLLNFCKEAYSYGFSDAPQYGVLRFLLETEIIRLSCIPDNIYSWNQKVYGFHGKNTVKNDTKIKDEREYSEGIGEGPTKINRVKVSKV